MSPSLRVISFAELHSVSLAAHILQKQYQTNTGLKITKAAMDCNFCEHTYKRITSPITSFNSLGTQDENIS